MNFLHKFKPEALVFKSFWDSSIFLLGIEFTYQSFADTHYVGSHCGYHLRKTEIPLTVSLVGVMEVFSPFHKPNVMSCKHFN